jgi:hypothetical protein
MGNCLWYNIMSGDCDPDQCKCPHDGTWEACTIVHAKDIDDIESD